MTVATLKTTSAITSSMTPLDPPPSKEQRATVFLRRRHIGEAGEREMEEVEEEDEEELR